jgi:hypothetical protein
VRESDEGTGPSSSSASASAAAPTAAAAQPLRIQDAWDTSYESAETAGEPLPFGRLNRVDLSAQRMRCLRKGDPCEFSSLIRRRPVDATTLTVIEDVYKAEVPDMFPWRSIIGGDPKSIETTF